MGLFKVGRGKGGSRTMSQIATEEEGKNTLVTEEERGERDTKYEPEKKASDMTGFVGSAAYKALTVGLHKQSMAWADKFIKRLTDVEEVKRLETLERDHPKNTGGRMGVLSRLAKMKVALDGAPTEEAGEFKKPEAQEKTDEDEDFSCQRHGCDFKAGSMEGLEGHVLAAHEDL